MTAPGPDDPLTIAIGLSATPLAIAGADGRIVSANPALAALLGYAERDIPGRSLEDLGLAEATLEASWEGDLGIPTASGADLPCLVRVRRCSDRGEPRFAVAFQDLRRAETGDNLRRELALVRPLEGLGRLLSGFAHDLTNIFQVVMGHGELVQRRISTTDPRLTTSLGYIADAAERGAAAAEAIVALGTGRQPARAEHSLTEVVRAALAGGATSIPAGVAVRLRLSEPGPRVLGDELALRRVVEELLSNAVSAMAGAGVLEIGTGTVEPAPGELAAELMVRDTGTGIPPEIVEAFRDPSVFARGNGPRLPGLGMAVVDRIIRDHRGRLDIVTAPGEGSTIRCRFPLVSLHPQE